jgi:cell wall-associated NlpC family hydrolase
MYLSGGQVLRQVLLSILAVLALGIPVFAEGVITLELDTPTLESNTPKTTSVSPGRQVTTVKAQVSQGQNIARVGQVIAERANIYSRMNTRAHIYSTCLKNVPIAIVSTSGTWYGVMMIDGSTGWIQSTKVKLLDYGIAAKPARSSEYASRGGLDRGYYGEGNALIQTALQYIGVPYVYGGTSTTDGIDCSAFVRTVFSQHGMQLPRVARDQANVGTPVTFDQLQAGDRLYFACKHSYVDHCGIYMGNGYFIHASASRGGVAIDNFSSRFYTQSLVAAMR